MKKRIGLFFGGIGNEAEISIISAKNIVNNFDFRRYEIVLVYWARMDVFLETRQFLPKIIASAIIGNNPEAFGFPEFESSDDEMVAHVMDVDYKPDNKLENKLELKQAVKKSENRKPVIYTVRRGNSINMIAEAFGVKSNDIKKWNKLKSSRLMAGQKLRIYPEKNIQRVAYKVKRETPYRRSPQSLVVNLIRYLFKTA